MKLLEGFILTFLAAGASSMHGDLATGMGLRFARIAEYSYIAVALVFLIAVLLGRRKKGRNVYLGCYLVAVLCMALPLLVVAVQSVKIPVAEGVSPAALSGIRAIYGNQIVITNSNGQTYAHVPRSILNTDVTDAISALKPTGAASDSEK